jgi:hypothetical protein
LLLLYGMMYVFYIAFFSTFALITTGYLVGFLVKRRLARTKPAVKSLEPAYT